ncbi:MAG: class I SAM-dependent methyltransferase [Deltaproteobacteria bacterium]|nr:class I SAM-dependent methyltransferase [Deltaproteobacteria bacterium]
MGHRVCPFWVGYLLLSPLRKLLERPDRILGPFVSEGMIVLEPGCGMGCFTLPLARMVGAGGKVVALEIQDKMLSVLSRRAAKAGLSQRIELRSAHPGSLGVDDLSSRIDLAVAIHMVHEVSDRLSFFTEAWDALKSGGKLLVVEPKHHVTQNNFDETVSLAKKVGFEAEPMPTPKTGLQILLTKHIH